MISDLRDKLKTIKIFLRVGALLNKHYIGTPDFVSDKKNL